MPCALFVLAALLAAAVAPAHAGGKYAIRAIESLDCVASQGQAFGLIDAGIAVGSVVDVSGRTQMFRHDSASGQHAGWREAQAGVIRAFAMDSHGAPYDIGTLGGTHSATRALDAAGSEVAVAAGPSGLRPPVELLSAADQAHWTLHEAAGINDHGEITATACSTATWAPS